MSYDIASVEIWAGTIEDRSGGAGRVLRALRDAGVNIEFAIARPSPDAEGAGVLFVAPITGDQAATAARQAGLKPSRIHALRVTGPDRPGLAAELTGALADEGVNLGGLSMAALGVQGVLYFRFNTQRALQRGQEILSRHLYA